MNQISGLGSQKLIRICISMIIVTIGVYWLFVLRPFLVPILVSVLLSILVSPILFQFEGFGIGKVPSVLLTLVLFFGLVTGVLYISFTQISEMIEMLPGFIKKAEVLSRELKYWLIHRFGMRSSRQINDLEDLSANLLQDNGSTALLKTTSILGDLVLIPLYMFFMLYYRRFFSEVLHTLMGKKEKRRVDRILFRIYDVVHNYLAGLFIVMVIVGAMNTISLLVLDIPYAVFFGFFAALLLLIPYIGVIIGSLLPIMMALVIKDSPVYALGVGATFMTIQFLEGNFITPYIVGSKISINPLMAIVALLLGGMLWGISGMVLALPMVAILKVILDHSRRLHPFGYLLGEPGKENRGYIFEDDNEENTQATNQEQEVEEN
jgi:predicted PurR-regulated permease PerM